MDTFIEFHSAENCLLENEKLYNLDLSYTFINEELTLELDESVQKQSIMVKYNIWKLFKYLCCCKLQSRPWRLIINDDCNYVSLNSKTSWRRRL